MEEITKESVTTIEATAREVFERNFSHLTKELERQKVLNWQIIIGVGVAFVFTVGLVGVEVMLFHTGNDRKFSELELQFSERLLNMERVVPLGKK